MTSARREVLNQLDTGNCARRYGKGWCLMGWPYTLIPRRTWEPLEQAKLVDDEGCITPAGRAAVAEHAAGRATGGEATS